MLSRSRVLQQTQHLLYTLKAIRHKHSRIFVRSWAGCRELTMYYHW